MGMQSYEQMTLTHYTQGGSTWKTDTYLRFPALRDLIPEDGSITSVQLIAMDEQGSAPFSIEAKMITQAWDPTLNPLGLLPTTQSYSPPLTSTWDCSPGTPRANRTLDITPLAQDWFQGLQNNFGLCLTIPTPDVIPNGITGLDLPVLVVKYTVQGIPSDPSFGGSYYTDAITPPVLVPGRAILVDRQGDVNNAIQSFVLTQFDMSQIIPFGEDTLSVQWTFEDTFSTSQSPIPFQRPAPVSNACYHTYTFPVLNGDPLLNKDIYPNFALQATLPENDPTPPGLLPSPPYLKDSIPYIQLDTTNPRNVVDISPLVNTPVSLDKYPHYPLTQFTSVLRPDASLGQIGTSVQSPLSSLPYVNTVSAENIGEKGELEMGSSTLQFQMPTLSSGNTSLRLDLVGGNAMYQDNPFPAFSYGQKGCIYPVTRNSIVMIETNADLVTLPPTNPFDQGIIYTPIGEYLIPPPDHYTPNPPTAIVSPISDGFVYIAAAGAAISFLPVQNPTVASNTEYYNPKITNMSLQVYPENPSSKRFAIHTQTEDITRWYDASGKLTEITSSIGGSITYTYDNNNPFRLLSIESTQSGSGIDLTYDAYGRLVEMQDTQQHQYQFQYDAQNNVVRSIDALNRSFWLNYDSNGIVTSISMTSPTRSTPLSLFTIGYQSVTTSSAILPCTEGDPSGDLRVHSVMDACGNETTISYNDTNHTVTVTDASGAESTYGFYHDGTLAYIENEDGERKTFVPDSENASPAPKEEIPCEEEYGNTYTYDSLRRLVQAEDYNGEIRSWTYNAQNKPTQYVDREGNALTIAYTQDGSSIQSITSASGQVMSYQYDQNQQVVSKTYPWKNNQTLSYQYTHDANGFIDTITDPLSRVTDFNYNSMGQLLTVTDPASRVTTYSYNALGKTTNIQFGKNGVNKNVSLEYNDLGQLTSITDPKGNSTSYTYDSCGRLSSVTDALSNTTSYTYNNMGQVTTVTDAKSHTTTYTYNDKHQCISVTDPDGKTTSYAYDPHGRVSTIR
jgi:YD repeat-containing protein